MLAAATVLLLRLVVLQGASKENRLGLFSERLLENRVDSAWRGGRTKQGAARTGAWVMLVQHH